MKMSEVIAELQERINLYGDSELVFRDCDDDYGESILSVYYDVDENVAVVSNFPWPMK